MLAVCEHVNNLQIRTLEYVPIDCFASILHFLQIKYSFFNKYLGS